MEGVSIVWVLSEYLAIKRCRFTKLTFLVKRECFLKHRAGPALLLMTPTVITGRELRQRCCIPGTVPATKTSSDIGTLGPAPRRPPSQGVGRPLLSKIQSDGPMIAFPRPISDSMAVCRHRQ